MIGELGVHLAFLGNFHPIIVHFPLALVPIALALKLWAWWRAQPGTTEAGNALLKLSLLFAILSALLGMINARANGFAMNQIGTHASFAWSAILVLAVAMLLPAYRPDTDSPFATALLAFARGSMQVLAKAWWLLKWIMIILLLPLVLIFLLLRKLYRLSLAKWLNPLLAGAWVRLKGAFAGPVHWLAGFSTYRNWKNLGYATSLLLILLTGLEGANLVHGEGHLARNAPAWISGWLGGEPKTNSPEAFNAAYFEQEIAPILRKNCMKCHGEDKARGDLQLHTLHHAISAGVVQYKSPMDSELIRRVLLSRSHPRAMPPEKNGRGLSSQEIAKLVAWINDEIGAESGGEHGPVIPSYYVTISKSLAGVSDDTIVYLNRHGASVVRLQHDYDLLGVNLQYVEADRLPVLLKDLEPHFANIVDLDVSGRELSLELVTAIGAMINLVRLNLARTDASDAEVAGLKSLRRLRWLNLYGTAITESADHHLEALQGLETLHLGKAPLGFEPAPDMVDKAGSASTLVGT